MAELPTQERILLLPVATTLALFAVREIAVALLNAASGGVWTVIALYYLFPCSQSTLYPAEQ